MCDVYLTSSVTFNEPMIAILSKQLKECSDSPASSSALLKQLPLEWRIQSKLTYT